RPQMDNPAHEDEPQNSSQHGLHGSDKEPPLDELAESGDKEAADGGDDVAGGTLAGHMGNACGSRCEKADARRATGDHSNVWRRGPPKAKCGESRSSGDQLEK